MSGPAHRPNGEGDMTRRRLRVTDLPPEAIRSLRDMDEVDQMFKRVFHGESPATRREFAPCGFWPKVKWIKDKLCLKENAL